VLKHFFTVPRRKHCHKGYMFLTVSFGHLSVSDVCQGDVSVFPSGSPSSENCFNVAKLAHYMMENELKKQNRKADKNTMSQ